MLNAVCLFPSEGIEKREPCISQPSAVIWHKTKQTAILHCSIASRCSSSLRYEWFIVNKHSHSRLNVTGKYSLMGSSLHIRSLSTNDSGIYHCAAADPRCCTPHVGEGVTLVVRGEVLLFLWIWMLYISMNCEICFFPFQIMLKLWWDTFFCGYHSSFWSSTVWQWWLFSFWRR